MDFAKWHLILCKTCHSRDQEGLSGNFDFDEAMQEKTASPQVLENVFPLSFPGSFAVLELDNSC